MSAACPTPARALQVRCQAQPQAMQQARQNQLRSDCESMPQHHGQPGTGPCQIPSTITMGQPLASSQAATSLHQECCYPVPPSSHWGREQQGQGHSPASCSRSSTCGTPSLPPQCGVSSNCPPARQPAGVDSTGASLPCGTLGADPPAWHPTVSPCLPQAPHRWDWVPWATS